MNVLLKNLNKNDKVIIVCDFNAHGTMWGSDKTDKNGQVIEQFVNHHNLTVSNDGEGTRLDTRTGKLSCLDLRITTPSLAYSKDIVSDQEKANAFGNYFKKIGIKDRDTNKELPKAPNNDIHILNVDHVINESFFII